MRRSFDTGLKGHRSHPINDSLSWSRDNPSVPEVVVTREGEEDEILSSRQASPIRELLFHDTEYSFDDNP